MKIERLTIRVQTAGDGEYHPIGWAHCPELDVFGRGQTKQFAVEGARAAACATARYVLAHPTDPRSPARKSAAEFLLEHDGDDAFEVIDVDGPSEPTEPGPEPGPQETQEPDNPWVP